MVVQQKRKGMERGHGYGRFIAGGIAKEERSGWLRNRIK